MKHTSVMLNVPAWNNKNLAQERVYRNVELQIMQYLGLVLVLSAIAINLSNLADNYKTAGIVVGLVGFAILVKERSKRDKTL